MAHGLGGFLGDWDFSGLSLWVALGLAFLAVFKLFVINRIQLKL